MNTKNQSLKCSQQVRNIPLERYHLPADGRKWKQAARSRSDFLVRLSTYANGDGTFVRNGRNYSPSLKTLLAHVGHGSYYRLTDDLQASGLLSWTREKHYERRIYTIHLPETGPALDLNQVPDSEITGPTFASEDQNQVPHSLEQVPHSQITGPTNGNHPSLPSLPSGKDQREREPSANEKPKPSLSLPSPSASAAAKTSGQEKIDAAESIQGLCSKLTGRVPNPRHVETLLQRFCLPDIEGAFCNYVAGLDPDSVRWAEKEFFADGKGASMVKIYQYAEWESLLTEQANNGGDIDEFLDENPVPPGLTNCDVLIKKARARLKRVKVDGRQTIGVL
jgi:hypothetical protein